MNAWALRATAERWMAAGIPAGVIEVADDRGSVPRAAGTRMIVSAEDEAGTIGGGHLEWEAVRQARLHLAQGFAEGPLQRTFALGPSLGQCCGGVVKIRIAPLGERELADWICPAPRFRLHLYGAGHVGAALARMLEDLDVEVDWIDVRASAFEAAPVRRLSAVPHIRRIVSDGPVQDARASAPGAHHLVMTHSHALDYDIVEALLRRTDTGWVGLIGSRTKRARFEHRLLARGVDPARVQALACPVGLPGIEGKEPAVIAVAVLAQLLALPAGAPGAPALSSAAAPFSGSTRV